MPGNAIDGGIFSLGQNVWAQDSTNLAGDQDGWDDHVATADVNLKIRLRGAEATGRPPGPYASNRVRYARAAVAETSSSASQFATSFYTSVPVIVDAAKEPINITTYQLSSVLLSVAAESGTVPRVAIHADSSGSPAANPLTGGTLTTPSGIATDLANPARAEFTASPALTLNRNTTYWVVVDAKFRDGKAEREHDGFRQ